MKYINKFQRDAEYIGSGTFPPVYYTKKYLQLVCDLRMLAEREFNKRVAIEYIDQFGLSFSPTLPETYDAMKNGVANYRVLFENEEVSHFTLSPFPEIASICISSNVYVDYKYRKKGIGRILNNLRIEMCRAANVQILMCVVSNLNGPQNNICQGNGWKLVHHNKATNLITYIHELHEKT
jgi:hypothetical protein